MQQIIKVFTMYLNDFPKKLSFLFYLLVVYQIFFSKHLQLSLCPINLIIFSKFKTIFN